MINKLANDIARAAQLKLVMINSEMEKRAALAKQADLMETLRALGAQAGDGLRNIGAQTSETLAPYIAKAKEGLSAAGAKAKEGLSAAGSKAKQGIGAAVDQANAFKQSIENVPVMQDRINNSLSKANTTISDLQNALSKEKANSDLSYLLDALNSGKENVGKDLNTAMLEYAGRANKHKELANALQELQGSASGINDNLSQLVSGLENKGYALGAGGALAGGLGGLGAGALMGSGSSQPDSGNAKKNKKKK